MRGWAKGEVWGRGVGGGRNGAQTDIKRSPRHSSEEQMFSRHHWLRGGLKDNQLKINIRPLQRPRYENVTRIVIILFGAHELFDLLFEWFPPKAVSHHSSCP